MKNFEHTIKGIRFNVEIEMSKSSTVAFVKVSSLEGFKYTNTFVWCYFADSLGKLLIEIEKEVKSFLVKIG